MAAMLYAGAFLVQELPQPSFDRKMLALPQSFDKNSQFSSMFADKFGMVWLSYKLAFAEGRAGYVGGKFLGYGCSALSSIFGSRLPDSFAAKY